MARGIVPPLDSSLSLSRRCNIILKRITNGTVDPIHPRLLTITDSEESTTINDEDNDNNNKDQLKRLAWHTS